MSIADLVNCLDGGVVLLDACGRVTFANETSQRLLGDGLSITHRQLRTSVHGMQTDLDRLIAGALRRSGQCPLGRLMLTRPSGRGRLLLHAVPILPRGEHSLEAGLLESGGVLMLIYDVPADRTPPVMRQLQQMGLTPAEARVAEAVGRGRSPKETANTLGAAEGTIRIQLKTVFSKLGVSRQSELAVLVTRLALQAGE